MVGRTVILNITIVIFFFGLTAKGSNIDEVKLIAEGPDLETVQHTASSSGGISPVPQFCAGPAFYFPFIPGVCTQSRIMDYEKVLAQHKIIVQEDVKSLLVPSSLVA